MDTTEFEIERVVLRHIKIPLHEPFRISNGSVSEKESIVVELYSGNAIGYGEASPMSGSFYSEETPETTWDALANDLVPDILSRTIQNPVGYAELLNDYIREPFARAGMEGAVWHLAATLLGTTIGDLFGAPRQRISSGLAVGIYDSIETLLDRIAQYLADGYQRTKIKIQPGWDTEPLAAIRKRFGDIPLMADANGAYNFHDHAKHLKSLDAFDLMMIEQPFASDRSSSNTLREMADLRTMIQTPLCVDESADSLERLEEIISCRSASIVNIKVQRLGGLWNAKRMLERAQKAGLECWLGTMPELGIASAQALAIASLPGFVYPTDIEASSRWFVDDITLPPIAIDSDGFIVYPKFQEKAKESAMFYRADRSKLEQYTINKKEFIR
ncbi:MAG TPA: o-succinylbenzoate synthase [Candidatus Kapabacteria bacterium]|jgi:O-succinylbenzoate synthase|nr:o-succinylbenzoate synthase [Candidatus Kapabacteria bacterium]